MYKQPNTPRIEAFKKITENLTERLQETLKAIEEIQPTTYQQITRYMKTTTNISTSRISDLKALGLICSAGTTRVYGNTQDLFRICTEEEAREIQKGLFAKYRTAKEDLERAYLELTDQTPKAKEVIKGKITHYKNKLRLLNKYAV
ncbi:hypothetical protein [Bergeyella zoohelcum]|uniref:hypothetical protein n=1 Tax=Bergeyella zoohelcum TaxID=1015 RepID=UPI002A91959B|nr:hypothetical protein [Bergeyella zoohelcum]MDY6024670.1 hypothetical protein [Bergeyella zoohelcum]